MDKLELRETIQKRIERPRIPDRVFAAQEFGVLADSEAVQTVALQQAIDAVSAQGGGRLELPSGRYRVGALHLKSGVELHLQSKDTVLSFVNESPELHYPVVFSHWEATPCYNFSPLIYACDAHDIAVTGEGVLDGGADEAHWWNWHHQVENAWSDDKPDLQLADRRALRQMNLDGVPVGERVFGPGHYLRPNFVQPIRCERVLLQGFTLRNSPMWQLNPVMCKSLTVDGVTLSSHGANNDGCDPESCSGVHICNCRFDTGDDCISLKSGRDRDGRIANVPCEHVLIENNEFADGHGGVALGSEMSGGIRRVLAVNNRFSSPNLTYALRLKTNARRGGRVEDVILADSVMDHVHGAAVHGTMLYEDGRNGDDLPVFRNITIENIVAHGGDYGIFLEAFDEVPITGLILRNIRIDGVAQTMRSMNWDHPVVDQVVINGKQFPRPGSVRILGVPAQGGRVRAAAEYCGGNAALRFLWQVSGDGVVWMDGAEGEEFEIPAVVSVESGHVAEAAMDSAKNIRSDGVRYVRVRALDAQGNEEASRAYRILTQDEAGSLGQEEWQRLYCRGMLDFAEEARVCEEAPKRGFARDGFGGNGEVAGSSAMRASAKEWITRGKLAQMMRPLADRNVKTREEAVLEPVDRWIAGGRCTMEHALQIAIDNGFLARDAKQELFPEGHVTRQEMATVAMQACGVNYRNASSTMPVCADVEQVSNNYGTNVARALYFGFMELEADGCFAPVRPVTVGEAVSILNRVADFAGI